ATVVRVSKSTGAVTTLGSYTTGTAQLSAIAVDANGVYVTVADAPNPGSVLMLPLSGGNATTLAPNRPVNFYANLAVSNGTLYWGEAAMTGNTGNIASVSTSGGNVATIQASAAD